MNRVDGVILGVGIVVLAASIIGVVLYDEDAGPTFQITWSKGDPIAMSEQTDSGGAATYTFDIPVNRTNLADVVATVDVSASGLRASDTTVSVELAGPDGEGGDCSFTIAAAASPGGAGTCDATATVQGAPEAAEASGDDAEAAERAAEEGFEGTAGAGTWTVTVTISGGQGLPAGATPSYQVAMTPALVPWDATAQPDTPDGAGAG